MKVLLLIAGLAFVYATDQLCQSPKEWEGRQLVYDLKEQYERRAKVSYDEVNMRVREIEEVEIGTDRDYYDVLYLHNIGKEYRLNLKTRKCNVTSLTRPFRPFGIHPDAEFRESATIGLSGVPGEFIQVKHFEEMDSQGNRYFREVTSTKCVPVRANFQSKTDGIIIFQFYDIIIGIADTNVFVPPRECVASL